VAFPDHHRYLRADIDRLLQIKARVGAQVFVTTEKDMVNLKHFSATLQPLQVAPLRLVLVDPQKVLDQLLTALEHRTGLHIGPSA
jgi:tetraacyldisaccharide-1-P 4'-kinase